MPTDPSQPPDPKLSDLGRAMLGGSSDPGSKPSGPWMPPTAEELARLLPGYEIVSMLGRGGMGAVYMGRQLSLDRPVAIKILSGALEERDLGFKERFKNEARAMARLNHPGIVSVYDSGETPDGLLYIVMEYVDGTDVARMIASEGRLHTEHAMAIAAHVCDALAYAHSQGIIHRDIKPANIMVGYNGAVKVADFGLAKVHTPEGNSLGLTLSGMAMGTMHYIAPEALLDGPPVDHRADLYAVGVMLYQMLTGRLPQGMFTMPSLQVPGLDPRYDAIIARAMMQEPEERYQDAPEFRAALDHILTQPVEKAEPAGGGAPGRVPLLPSEVRPKRPGARRMSEMPSREMHKAPARKPKPPLWPWLAGVAAVIGVGAYLFLTRTKPETGPTLPVTSANLSSSSPVAPDSNTAPDESASVPPTSAPSIDSAEQTVTGRWLRTSHGPDNLYEDKEVVLDLLPNHLARWTIDGDVKTGSWSMEDSKTVSGRYESGWPFSMQLSTPIGTPTLTVTTNNANGKPDLSVYQKSAPLAPNTPSPPTVGLEAEGWTSLFNATDLTGWQPFPDTMPVTVENGMIRIKGVATRGEGGHLFHVGTGNLDGGYPDWKDFEAIVTVKTSKLGNSGFKFHSRPKKSERGLNVNGIEVNLWNEGMIAPVDRDHRTGSAFGIAPVAVSHFSDEEWFSVRILIEGKRLRTWVKKEGATDWTPAVDWTEPDNWMPPSNIPNARLGSGTIAFTNWVPEEGEVWIKEVKIKLPQDSPASPSGVEPTSNSPLTFNNHRYEFVPGSFSWEEAKSQAESMGGHLATITSKEENDWILGTFGRLLPAVNRNLWLGAIEDAPGSGWKWVTGEPFAPIGWVESEPNGVKGGGGQVGHPFMLNLYSFRDQVGWNDSSTHFSQKRDNVGFIVEFESPEKATLIPQKTSVSSLLGQWFRTNMAKPGPAFEMNLTDSGDAEWKGDGQISKGTWTRLADGSVQVVWKSGWTYSLTESTEAFGPLVGNATGPNGETEAVQFGRSEAPANPNLWTDAKGRQLEAAFVRVESDKVVLNVRGKETPVPLNSLSPESQAQARQLSAAAKPASRYSVVTETVPWAVANSRAAGMGGKLASIETKEEQDLLAAKFGDALSAGQGYWIGGAQTDANSPWKWRSGEPIETFFWHTGEPNNTTATFPGQNVPPFYLCFHRGGSFGWNDLSESDARWRQVVKGFIVEWEEASADSGPPSKPGDAPEEAFTPLFQNESLDGWTGDTGAYQITNGIVTGREKGDLISPGEYGNFILRFDLRLSAGANSGIGIWRDAATGLTKDAAHGFEVQILDDTAQEYLDVDPWGRHGGIFYFQEPSSFPMKVPGSWNSHEIRVEGNRIEVTINGQRALEADLDRLSPKVARAPKLDVSRRRGHLILLGRKGTVDFRNPEIRSLP